MTEIIDTNHDTTHRLDAIKAAGTTTLGRYISRTMTDKVIREAEARAIAAAGMRLFLIYEEQGRPSGIADGTRAGEFTKDYAAKVGAPAGTIIWYTVDYDAGDADLPGILAAFHGFAAALAPTYRVGAYASGYINGKLKAAGAIVARWLTQSRGFRGTHDAIAAGDYEMLQGPETTAIGGIDSDTNTRSNAATDIGAFVPFAAPDAPPATGEVDTPGGPEIPPLDRDEVAKQLGIATEAFRAGQNALLAIYAELGKSQQPRPTGSLMDVDSDKAD